MTTIGLNHDIDPEPYAPIGCPLCKAHGRVTFMMAISAKGTEFFTRCVQCDRECSAIQPVAGATAGLRGVTLRSLARLGL